MVCTRWLNLLFSFCMHEWNELSVPDGHYAYTIKLSWLLEIYLHLYKIQHFPELAFQV